MSMWKQWKKSRQLREGLEGDPVDNFKFNTDDEDLADDYEHVQQELFDSVMSKYPDETMQFLDGIAQRGDEEIAALLRKLQMDKGTTDPEGHNPRNPPEVVPPVADTGNNAEFGGDE